MKKYILDKLKNGLNVATRTRLKITAVFALLVLIPLTAAAQFGMDPCCALISVGLHSISSALTVSVANPLSGIALTESNSSSYNRNVIYPAASINQARGLVTQLLGQIRSMRQIYLTPTNSATLPGTQQLERLMLSRNPQLIVQVGQQYPAIYGSVMPANTAPPAVRQMTDMADAEAQAAMKKAIQIDALADAELQVADQINQQIQTAAPGTAPMLEAHASAWVVRSNAYTQSAYAELIRIRSIELARNAAQLKLNAGDTAGLRSTTGQMLGGTN